MDVSLEDCGPPAHFGIVGVGWLRRLQENLDGSILLQPARVVSEAQAEYDNDPELRELLARATQSPTVRRNRERRTT